MPSEPTSASPRLDTSTRPVIPDYELIRPIGRGSYGDVWLAHGLTGVYRAVKVVWRERFPDPEPFEREFKGLRGFAAVSLTEQRQLALLHVGRNDPAGFFYYVMELADDIETGRAIDPQTYVPYTLKELKARRGRIDAAETLAIGIELVRGLIGLHDRHLIHRDIKPSNVIMVGGSPKLADIGLVTFDTEARTFVGTEGFVPPEGPGSAGADIYGVGKLLYELATGLDRKDYPRLPPDFHSFPDRKLLLELNEILIRACEADPAKRYANAQALLDDLFLLQAGRSIRRLRYAEKSLRQAIRVGIFLGVAASVAAVGAFVERRRAADETARRETAEAERDVLASQMLYSGGLARAERAIETGDVGRARRYLREIAPPSLPVDLRDLEWWALWNSAAPEPSDFFDGGGERLERIRTSPDGRTVASVTNSDRVLIWDRATHRLQRTMPGIHRLVGFSSDGLWLVGSDARFRLQRWQLATGLADSHPSGGVNRPFAPLGPDGVIAMDDDALELRRWDFRSGRDTLRVPIRLPSGRAGWNYISGSESVSDDGRYVALALARGAMRETSRRLQVYDLEARALVRDEPVAYPVAATAISPDDRLLASTRYYVSGVVVTPLLGTTPLWSRAVGTDDTTALAFSPDGQRLAGGGRQSDVWVRDARSGALIRDFHGHDGGIQDVTWSGRPVDLYSADGEGAARRWNFEESRPPTDFGGFWPREGDPWMCLSQDGRWFAATVDGSRSDAVDLSTPGTRLSLEGATIPIGFAPSQDALLGFTSTGVLSSWPLRAGSAPSPLISFFDGTKRIAVGSLSPDQRFALAAEITGKLAVWNLRTKKRLLDSDLGGETAIWSGFSPDSSLVAAKTPMALYVWSTATGAPVGVYRSLEPSVFAAFDPANRWIAIGDNRNSIELVSLPSLALERRITIDSSSAKSLTVTPDGKRLLCGGTNGAIHIYDTNDWRELLVLAQKASISPRGGGSIEGLALNPSATTLVAYRADGLIHIWDCRP